MRLCKLVQLVKIHSKATKEKLPDLEVGNNANIEESLLPVRNGFCHYKRKLMWTGKESGERVKEKRGRRVAVLGTYHLNPPLIMSKMHWMWKMRILRDAEASADTLQTYMQSSTVATKYISTRQIIILEWRGKRRYKISKKRRDRGKRRGVRGYKIGRSIMWKRLHFKHILPSIK